MIDQQQHTTEARDGRLYWDGAEVHPAWVRGFFFAIDRMREMAEQDPAELRSFLVGFGIAIPNGSPRRRSR